MKYSSVFINGCNRYRLINTKAQQPCLSSLFCVPSHFQNNINFDFSPIIGQDMAKHKKVVWGDG
jgi:hypothetical protein